MDQLKRQFGRASADLAALLVVTIWGISFAFQKATLEQLDVLPFTALRYLGMLVLAWGTLIWHRRVTGDRISIARADLPHVALAGVLGYVLYILVSTLGLSYTTAFSNAVLSATAPLFMALLLRALRIERIGFGQFAGMIVSYFGVFVFLLGKLQVGLSTALVGDLITLASTLAFAAYSVANKPLLDRYPVTVVMTYTLTFGTIPVLLFSIPATFTQDWTRVTAAGWLGLAWTIIFPVYVAWTIWNWAIARVGVARTSVFMYLVPIVGGIASWLILGEGFGTLKIAGALLILAGLALTRRLAAFDQAEQPRPIARSGVVHPR